MKVAKHLLRSWSTTQPTTATSSGEAKLLAMAEAASRALGMRAMVAELLATDEPGAVSLHTGSSAAKSFAPTRGPGRMRHLEVKSLWLQERMRQGKVEVWKVAGANSVADILTSTMGRRASRDYLLDMEP